MSAAATHGTPIHARTEDKMVSLTDMHRASGRDRAEGKPDPSKRPSHWLASVQAKDFIAAFAEITGVRNSDTIISGESGDGGGGNTWAHWQIGRARTWLS